MIHTELEAAYYSYSQELYNYALKRTDSSTADDVVQQVFTRLAQHRDPVKYLRPFLYKIATDEIINWKRMRKASQLLDTHAVDTPPDANLCQQETQAQVKSAVGRLTPSERVAINLVCYEELSGQEAASKIGVTANAVRTRIHAAMGKLRHSLR
jgi:RNA polymerase sigma factor (sigma-70 family)